MIFEILDYRSRTLSSYMYLKPFLGSKYSDMLRSPHRKQPSAWFTLGTLNIKSPNKISLNHRFFSKTFAHIKFL